MEKPDKIRHNDDTRRVVNMPLEIKIYPDPVLRQHCIRVDRFDKHLAELIKHMTKIMDSSDGVGLAAPQVGITKNLFVFKTVGEDKPTHKHIINPEIIEKQGRVVFEEGCLSLPELTAKVKRAEQIKIKGQNKEGKEIIYETDKFWSVILQHEIDHLHGKLIIDYLSPIKRSLALSRYKKGRKSN